MAEAAAPPNRPRVAPAICRSVTICRPAGCPAPPCCLACAGQGSGFCRLPFITVPAVMSDLAEQPVISSRNNMQQPLSACGCQL